MHTHTFGTSAHRLELAALRSAVVSTLEAGGRELTVGLDGVTWLDAELLHELIRGQRRLREVGGTLRLANPRPEFVRALENMGLDRVFKVLPVRVSA